MPFPLILTLPLELLEEIAEIVHIDTQLSICRVSKLFHSLTIRSIYRHISLDSPSAVVACCRTLAINQNAAIAVRKFSITYTPSEPPKIHYFSPFYALIGKALSCLSKLQELKLMVFDPNYIQTLNIPHFPTLHHFECYLALTDSLILFLNRHPTINYLQIAPNEALGPPPVGNTHLQVALPKLQYFIGNSECVSALVPNASLRAAFICWDAVDATPQDAIRSLERSSGDTINLVSCRRRGWNLDLIDLISIWLPNIYVLSITNLLVVDTHPSETYLHAIRSILPRFSMLRHLHLHCVDTWKMNDVRCNLEDDFITVTAWGTACPSLVECILPHSNNMKWLKTQGLWIPDLDHPQGIEWTWNMLRSKRYPQWDQLLAAVGDRIRRKAYSREFEGIITVLRSLSLGSSSDNYAETADMSESGGNTDIPTLS